MRCYFCQTTEVLCKQGPCSILPNALLPHTETQSVPNYYLLPSTTNTDEQQWILAITQRHVPSEGFLGNLPLDEGSNNEVEKAKDSRSTLKRKS